MNVLQTARETTLTVLKRPYYCIYSIRLDDYGKQGLNTGCEHTCLEMNWL